MELYPAIDLRGGRVVRLLRGDYDAETVYGEDPRGVAAAFAAAGARWIHVVDLDAARVGRPVQVETIAGLCAEVDACVQVGGGVRDVDAARALVDAGVDRLVVGTAAIEDPGALARIATAVDVPVAAGVDARDGEVRVRGWTEGSGRELVEVARTLTGAGAAALIVTEIERDGTLAGPDTDQLRTVLEAVDAPVVASGGVGSLDDLRELVALAASRPALEGVIVGRALYEGRFDVGEGVVACSPPG